MDRIGSANDTVDNIWATTTCITTTTHTIIV